MKKLIAILLAIATLFALCSCGAESGEKKLSGDLSEIITKIYETADVNEEQKDAFGRYAIDVMTDETKEYLLGTTEVNYVEGVSSYPRMSSIAYQLTLLRVEEGADIEAIKTKLAESANPIKWVCVEAEKVLVENIGDVVILAMGEEATVNAIYAAAQALAE